ncbi:MAG TPA: glycosyltransferase family 2 protein [Terriglobales bacterium]|nr:glycosyltransferase family 2 protein [Terriglobales bacterium]
MAYQSQSRRMTRMTLDDASIKLSVVIPCFNEAGNIPSLLRRIDLALEQVSGIEFEILLVDDASTDATSDLVESWGNSNPHVGYLRFVRNFGQQSALLAGIEHARGDAVIVMDADLQHPPELIPEMIEHWRGGFDVVQALREGQPGLTKSLSSRMFYKVLNCMSEVPVQDGATEFRLMSRRAVDALLAMPERSRFLRGLVAWLGFPCATIPFMAPPRNAGKTAYSPRKMMALAEEGIISLSSKPLHLALYVAILTLFSALLYGFYVSGQYLRGASLVRGWTSTIFLILLLGSANLFCSGILGLYLSAVLTEIRRRPTYVVSQFTPATQSQRWPRTSHEPSPIY